MANNLTDAVVASFANTDDPRMKEIFTALVRHLHGFVEEVQLTDVEWAGAIDFLTRTGQKCDATRQEYILLSDVLGVSMLVVGLDDLRGDPRVTQSTVLGPFFVEGAPLLPQLADLGKDVSGEPLYVDVRICDTDGNPVANAPVDVWHSDDAGFYDVQHDHGALSLRGTFTSDTDGCVRFWSILPPPYPIPTDGPVGALLMAAGRHPWRPAHIHFKIAAPGFRQMVTHIFPQHGAYLDSDAVFGVKDALVHPFPSNPAGVAPDGRVMDRPWRSLNYDFVIGRD